ncbi:hypothetical protein L218DRAFT_947775 [Marasmius fiardii PR-910]|nr:hypothetical protein L218DRAFT_947775 [Marasmius fiardii PR-910]
MPPVRQGKHGIYQLPLQEYLILFVPDYYAITRMQQKPYSHLTLGHDKVLKTTVDTKIGAISSPDRPRNTFIPKLPVWHLFDTTAAHRHQGLEWIRGYIKGILYFTAHGALDIPPSTGKLLTREDFNFGDAFPKNSEIHGIPLLKQVMKDYPQVGPNIAQTFDGGFSVMDEQEVLEISMPTENEEPKMFLQFYANPEDPKVCTYKAANPTDEASTKGLFVFTGSDNTEVAPHMTKNVYIPLEELTTQLCSKAHERMKRYRMDWLTFCAFNDLKPCQGSKHYMPNLDGEEKTKFTKYFDDKYGDPTGNSTKFIANLLTPSCPMDKWDSSIQFIYDFDLFEKIHQLQMNKDLPEDCIWLSSGNVSRTDVQKASETSLTTAHKDALKKLIKKTKKGKDLKESMNIEPKVMEEPVFFKSGDNKKLILSSVLIPKVFTHSM